MNAKEKFMEKYQNTQLLRPGFCSLKHFHKVST